MSGGKVVLVPLPPAVGRAIDCAIGGRMSGPILLNSGGNGRHRRRRCGHTGPPSTPFHLASLTKI